MNVLIDIPEDIYTRLKAGDTNAGNTALESISNGVVLLDKKPYLVFEQGGCYLEPRYIDAMLAFETRLKMAEALDQMVTNLDGVHKYNTDNMTVRELEKAFPDIDVPKYDGDKNIILMFYNKEDKNG